MGCPPSHLMQVATWTMLVYELVVGVFSLLAVADVYYLTPTDSLIFYAVAAGLYAAACIVVSVLARGDPVDFIRTFVGDFFALGLVLSVVRTVLAGIWLGKFGDLSPLSFTVNADAFAVYRSIMDVALAVFIVITAYIVASLRVNYVSRIVDRHQRALLKQGTYVGAALPAAAVAAAAGGYGGAAAPPAAVTPGEPRAPRVPQQPARPAASRSGGGGGGGGGSGLGGFVANLMDGYAAGAPPASAAPTAAAAIAMEARRAHAAVGSSTSPVYESSED